MATVPRLIEKPYCDDFINPMKKGEKMYDLDAGDLGKYPGAREALRPGRAPVAARR